MSSKRCHIGFGPKERKEHLAYGVRSLPDELPAQEADGLVQRNFTASAPNEKWLTNITELKYKDGNPLSLRCFGLLRRSNRGDFHGYKSARQR